ncbi:MAG TPA: hypothetical protein VNO70_01165 [Blastocatellia bacterium]|nr:hypothetical protein [Blastocatellia bacterium]
MISEQVNQITFRHLDSTDSIFIETQNSHYTFFLLDPLSGQGLLSGGALGEGNDPAVLLGALVEEGNDWKLDPTGLRVDAGALFLLDTPNGLKRLTISRINRIFYRQSHKKRKVVAWGY